MHRRNFLKSGAIAGIGIPVTQLFGTQSSGQNIFFLPEDEFELNEITIDILQQKMQSGELSSKKITELYLQRIQSLNKQSIALNAVIEINPDAIAIAMQMDEERKTGKLRGPMHGIPVLIKDNINTGDKMKTTAGAIALANHHAEKDAFLVSQLRNAGAVILGKTNLSEWANFKSSVSSSGYSEVGGQTKNPFILDRNPCGSSSGSAVAVTANLCAVAVGTETDGSIVCPSSVCGVVGLKPTVGLISRSGIIPISNTQDTAGPMARTVRDLAILLNALIGADPNDGSTKESGGKSFKDYGKFLNAGALKGKRLGVEKNFKSANAKMNELYALNINYLRDAGAEIIEIEFLEKINEFAAQEFDLLKYEFKDGLNKYLSTANASVKTLSDVIAFNNLPENKKFANFDQEILETSDQFGDLNSEAYKSIYQKCHLDSRAYINSLISDFKLHAFAGLTAGPACATDLIYGDKWGDVYLGVAPAITGFPHITVPCGFLYGLPVGFSFFTGAYGEPELISLAFGFEQLSKQRSAPQFQATL